MTKDYCQHLLKVYCGDRGAGTRPESGKDYLYCCCHFRDRDHEVRADRDKALDTFCKGCKDFLSHNEMVNIARAVNAKISEMLRR